MSAWELQYRTEQTAMMGMIVDGCIVIAAVIAFAVLWWWLV